LLIACLFVVPPAGNLFGVLVIKAEAEYFTTCPECFAVAVVAADRIRAFLQILPASLGKLILI